MAKKSTTQKQNSSKEKGGFFDSTENWLPWALALVAFFLYSTGLNNQMVGMDDHTATIDNPAVRDFQIFNGFNLGMYAPVTWIGYEIAYIFGKESPTWYHFLSALVHAVNVVLVFRLFRRLDSTLTVAGLVAFFFAIHPLQVEAVAWIAGFSTPLFSMFSLLSMNYYLRHTKEDSFGQNYWLSLGMFLVACLAKSAAVVLPLTLMVLDWWKKRALTQKTLLEKAPFFLISLGFGALTIYSRQFAGQLDQPAEFKLFDRLLMASHSIVFYWKKLLFPTGLSIWYPFEKTNGAWSWDYYAAPFILLGILFAGWRSRNALPVLWFGLLFYLSNIILSLPWATFGTFELRSDRYNYLAGIGIFAILATLPDYVKAKKPDWANGFWMLLMGLAAVWLLTSFLRIRDWKDTGTLINKAIAATGDNFGKAYLWRGMAYGKASETQAALKDFSQAIQKNPLLVEAYKFRGNIYGVMKNYQQSVDDLTKFLEKHPDEVPELYNRGLSYANMNKNQEAAADFSKAIALDSTFIRVFRARGNCYKKMGEYEKAIADLSHYLEKFPNEAGELYNRGTCYAALDRNKEAIDDFTLALKNNPQFAEAYQGRANVYIKLGETGKADTDMQLFRSMQK